MADDIANLLHNSYGLPKTGKSAPMGAIKKGGVQSSQSKGGVGKSSGVANSDPIQDDAFSGSNGTFGSKSAGVGASYAVGDDPFYPGTVKSSSTYGDNDIFGMGSTGGAKGYSSIDDPFAMPGSYSSSPATTSFVDPFGGLGSMNSGPSGGAGAGTPFSGDDLLGGFGAGKARSSDTPERQGSQDPFQTLDPDPVFSTTPSLSTPPSSHPADANDPFSIPSPATSTTAATSSSNGHGGDAFGGLNDFLSAKPVSTSSGKSGGSGASPNVSFRRGNDDKESPQPSPHKHRGFFGRKKEEPPTPPAEEILKASTVVQNVPGEDAWLTVEDLVLSLVTMPTSTPPPSRPPPPPGTQRRKPPPPPPPYQQAAPSPSSWQQPPKSEPPPSYAYAQQAPQSWPPPGSRRPSQPESTPNYTPPNKSTTPEAGPSNMDGFDAFGSARSSDGKFSSPRSNQTPTPPSEPDKHDAEATAAAQAAASSSAQMAEAMERAKEKAARARAAKEREDARRAREEAAERLRREAQAKTQRPVDTGFVNNDFFNAPPRRSESDARMRPPPQSDFMSDPPRAPGGFSNLDDLGSVGGRRPAAPPAQPPKPTTPAPTPSTAATANDWADILGGGGGGGATSSSDTFQEIEGETAERRELRYQKWQTIQQRATEALAEKNRRDVEAQKEQNERSRADDLYAHEIKRWAQGKEGNLIALLSTLQHVLWPECGWEPMSITDLISPAQVKKAYRKATLCVHPDKVQQKGANVHQKYIAEKVFDLLKEAWNKYNQNNLF